MLGLLAKAERKEGHSSIGWEQGGKGKRLPEQTGTGTSELQLHVE